MGQDTQIRIGEVMILGFKGPELPRWLADFEKKHGLGGVILFDYDVATKEYRNNIFSREQVKALCASVHQLPSFPLCFVDQEGGKVRRLKESLGFAPLPSAKDLAALPAREREVIIQTSLDELRELGFDFNLAPVADIDFNSNNPDIGAIGRSFSRNPEMVSENIQLFSRCASESGIGLCLKHYPGLGGAKTNSHEQLTEIGDTIAEEQLEIFYEQAPQIPGQALLISHGIVRQWDPKLPVSMSNFALNPLRHSSPDLLLISDDLQMQGLQAVLDTPKACLHGLVAGLDMLIIGNNLKDEQSSMSKVADELKEAVLSDPKLLLHVNQAVQRISRRKREFKGL